ncbi:phenylalanine--tRNA ligase subunit beta [Candidatus Oleimmundimicrobium sp.]|uniref:phenylalanine--tRNA ligase subunit beta n=1 Tax=Candidatus Oleimmundimicrobium sp. TaxID=3060597 RepID=UPI00271DDDF7|nr:phenylalanine--tRNA ligase subunit beta [Candidatus Oleimmundimicrobium sp.]MDO8885552.1 phenylalanine--tRNA ligase subunit beta [Candidatus Oleimmundimicrobium sp.]
MRVSLNWLKDYVDFDISIEELIEKLNLSGTAVESVQYLGKGLENIVVGQIKKIESHPNADKLVVCQVDVGAEAELTIVCGAKNMKEGDKVPVALVGAVLPNGMEIKKAKLRSVESYGMMCSAIELNIGDDASGLMILDPKLKIGEELSKTLNLKDVILELEITPNRPDCLGTIGIAREVTAITDGKLKKPVIEIEESEKLANDFAGVEIVDPELCPRYVARIIKDVKIGPSPRWFQQRLKAVGLRPINNIVDITNYVMWETSQPLHAFDYEKIKNGKIIVRRAKNNETILTLDDVERRLDDSMLVIADSSGPIALAGVMGGVKSEVSESTTTILLESAYFKPTNIMRTSRGLGLISESSLRFERGTDPGGTVFAADRAAQLMAEFANGKVLKGIIDVYPKKIMPKTLKLRVNCVNEILGTDLPAGEMDKILESLEIEVSKAEQDNQLNVLIPTFRPDLEREIDLIEEIGRIYGYNRIQSTLPESSGKQGGLSLSQKIEKRIKNSLTSSGFWETINYSFVTPNFYEKIRLDKKDPLAKCVLLKNPLSEEQSVLRTTLIPGLLDVAKRNVNRDIYNAQVFEMGRVFRPVSGKELPDEPLMVAGAATGSWSEGQWFGKEPLIDFFDVKGAIENLLADLGIKDWFLRKALHSTFHPGKCAELLIDGDVAGILGEVHPEVNAAYEFPNKVVVFELFVSKLVSHAKLLTRFEEIPRYPGISLDVSLIVDEKVLNEQIVKVIRAAGDKLLKEVRLFDLYTGKNIPTGKKSLAYSLTYQASDRTLTDEEVMKVQKRVIAGLEKKLGAEIRVS